MTRNIFLAKNMLRYIKLVLTHISKALYMNVTKFQTRTIHKE